ncbi:MAG TPA: hypothetical protein VMZ91_08975 [Candidatus Paceibacterota bacterium]|nr:hypothetical protein [Candidatus Paceibacterota bacterium]
MDKIETLNKRLREVVDKFNEFQKIGINEDILEMYLQQKTKLSKKNVRLLLKNYEEFYHKLLKEEIVKGLK